MALFNVGALAVCGLAVLLIERLVGKNDPLNILYRIGYVLHMILHLYTCVFGWSRAKDYFFPGSFCN